MKNQLILTPLKNILWVKNTVTVLRDSLRRRSACAIQITKKIQAKEQRLKLSLPTKIICRSKFQGTFSSSGDGY